VRARAAFSPGERLHAVVIRAVHHFMETAQLRHLAARVEGRQRRDDWRDVLAGVGGAARMLLAWISPGTHQPHHVWGLSDDEAARRYPGDERVTAPRWEWTHAVEIDASVADVWPWIAQIGVDRAGFYSYQWLENLAGCQVRNAEVIHPEWQMREGDELRLHPRAPALEIAQVEEGRFFVASGPADEDARREGRPWVEASWLFLLEPRGESRCRLVSRYRAACSADLATRLAFGPALLEPIGTIMDRRMLLGVKERAETLAAAG
jgi:hypothetical protein